MSIVRVISDLHFGHKNIANFRKGLWTTELEHREAVIEAWNSLVKKHDTTYILGDAAFTDEGLEAIKKLKGMKVLIRGNHDVLNIRKYLGVFNEVYGIWKKNGVWMSHAPIHPDELRGHVSCHGHVHYETIKDSRYFNCCVENVGLAPITFDEVRARIEENKLKEDWIHG